jgi:hypothetical protein
MRPVMFGDVLCDLGWSRMCWLNANHPLRACGPPLYGESSERQPASGLFAGQGKPLSGSGEESSEHRLSAAWGIR